MPPDELIAYCETRPGAWPDNPWDHDFPGVQGRPGGARKTFAFVGRSGWNDLTFGGAISDDELLEAVDESYRLVVAKLLRKHRPDDWDV